MWSAHVDVPVAVGVLRCARGLTDTCASIQPHYGLCASVGGRAIEAREGRALLARAVLPQPLCLSRAGDLDKPRREASVARVRGATASSEVGSGTARTGTQEAWHLLHRVIASAWPSASPPAPPLASLAPVRWWRAVRRGRNCAVCRNRGASLHVHSSGLQPLVLETLRSCGAARRLEFEKRLQESRDRVGVLASEVVFLV